MTMLNLTRIMCIGFDRLWEAMVTLSFDYNLTIKPNRTYIFSPHSEEQLRQAFKEFGIDDRSIEIFNDNYFNQYYDLSLWVKDNWYRQQALKLCSLDFFNSDYFLIQDADIALLKPYNVLENGTINFKVERLWHEHHKIYSDMVEEITGLKRVIDYSFVSEIMPYTKRDWYELKAQIEKTYGVDFLQALHVRDFDKTKWFSEYELLGIFKTNNDKEWTSEIILTQPPITTWEEFRTVDWNQYNSIRFHVRPFKRMSQDQAKGMIKHLKDNYDTVN